MVLVVVVVVAGGGQEKGPTSGVTKRGLPTTPAATTERREGIKREE